MTTTYATPGEMLRRHGLKPKRDWGQNFLGDESILDRIAAACSLSQADSVVELGAGLGHLTRRLAATGAQVVAVERDRDLVPVLEQELALPNVRVLAANAADLDFAKAASRPRTVVAGNLPYHLSSSILFQLLDQRASVTRGVFLLQKEVAIRIAAPSGNRDYGLLSALLQTYAYIERLFDVPRGSFLPPPAVDSSVVRIDFRDAPSDVPRDLARYTRLVKAAFGHRRKTLLNALKADPSLGDPAALLARAGIEPERRAESLSPTEFVAIERALRPPRD